MYLGFIEHYSRESCVKKFYFRRGWFRPHWLR